MGTCCKYPTLASKYLPSPLRLSSFVGAQQATQSELIAVNDAGNAIMKVDNTTTLNYGENRNSIRISSTNQYTVGSLWVADILHLPYGVSLPCVLNTSI